jgi:hypothetical protein
VAVGGSVIFTVAASGTPTPTVQWQVSTDSGSNWSNLANNFAYSGVASGSLQLASAAIELNGYRYRCLATNSEQSNVPSNAAILTVLSPFAVWQQAHFTADELANVNKSGPNAIYGHDGLTTLVKYALGLDPKINTTTGVPVASSTANDWVYTYTRPTTTTDVAYAVEISTDLLNWTPSGVTHEFVSTANGTDTWRGRYPLASAAKIFFRLKVTR